MPNVSGVATPTPTLSDALGRQLRTQVVALPAAGLRHELRLGGLAPGLYLLQVQAGDASGVRRVVVE